MPFAIPAACQKVSFTKCLLKIQSPAKPLKGLVLIIHSDAIFQNIFVKSSFEIGII